MRTYVWRFAVKLWKVHIWIWLHDSVSGSTRTSITGDERKERLTFPGSVTWNQNLFQEVEFNATKVALETCLMRGNLLLTVAKFAAKKRMNYKIMKVQNKDIYKGITIGGVQTQQNGKVKVVCWDSEFSPRPPSCSFPAAFRSSASPWKSGPHSIIPSSSPAICFPVRLFSPSSVNLAFKRLTCLSSFFHCLTASSAIPGSWSADQFVPSTTRWSSELLP